MKKYISQNKKILIVTIVMGILFSIMSAFFAIISAAILIYFSPIIFVTLVLLIALLTVFPGLFNKVLEKRQNKF